MKGTGEKTDKVITTYMERDLHLSLKYKFCRDRACHEIKVGRYVADVLSDGTVYEIQTGSFSPLRKKLEYYLENTDYKVVIVKPLAKNRRIFWLDEASGEVVKAPRLSSKHETLTSGISDLYYIRDFLGRERISFCFVMMEIDEMRKLDGYGKSKKIRATSVDRIAGEIYSTEYINNVSDLAAAVLPLLPDEPFSRDELSKCLGLKGMKLWSAQKLLLETHILTARKDGRRLIFER